MNIHICKDNKFYDEIIKYIIENDFEKSNLFLLITDVYGVVRYFPKYDNVVFVDKDYSNIQSYINTAKVKKIIIHNMTDDILKLLNKNIACQQKEIYWLSWGTDYYHFMRNELCYNNDVYVCVLQSYGKSKYDILFDRYIRKNVLYRKLRYQYMSIKKMRYKEWLSIIDYYCVWNDYECVNLKKCYSSFKAEYKYFAYSSCLKNNDAGLDVERYSDFISKSEIKILIGHSGYDINDHIGAFEILKNSGILEKNIKIYVPVSYGDKVYIDYVVKTGYSYFGDKFVPITGFMQKNKYYDILLNMDIIFMNNIQVVGVTNIMFLMNNGAFVVMRKENVLYQYLISRGAKIFLSEDVLSPYNENILRKFTATDKKKNSTIINDLFDKKKVMKSYESIFS